MVMRGRPQLNREDWLRETLKVLQQRGVGGVKIVAIAARMGVTSGSFYWHFKDLRDLVGCLLEYWEQDLTDALVGRVRNWKGPPEERILILMLQVIEEDSAVYDHAISVWARSDSAARKVFARTLRKRFDFAAWMFKRSGFCDQQAVIRGRLLVAYLMGESAVDLKSDTNWRAMIREQHEVLTNGSVLYSGARN
jgi:AcrR family transcriptional regulator